MEHSIQYPKGRGKVIPVARRFVAFGTWAEVSELES